MADQSRKPARKSKIFGIIAVLAIGALVVRASILYCNTSQLVGISDQFPHEYSVGTNQAYTEITYLALGDSTVQGAGASHLQETIPYLIAAQIAAQGYRVKVINRGVVGATIADVERDQLANLDTLHPAIITLNVGSNDATHFTDYTEFGKHMRNVLGELSKKPTTVVAVANTPDLSLVPALQPISSDITAWRARQQNKILSDILNGSNIHLVDLYDDGKLSGKENYASDEFHPAAQGYATWAALFGPVTKNHLTQVQPSKNI